MKKILFLSFIFILFSINLAMSEELDINIVKKVSYREIFYSNILYPLTIRGCRFFLNDIKDTLPDIHTGLNPLVSKIEMNNIIAWASLFGGIIIGSGLASYGIFSTGFDPDPDAMALNMTLSISGGGLVIAGCILWYFLVPKQEHLFQVINHFNMLNPDNPANIR